MAFADAKGQSSGAIAGYLDVTHERFEAPLAMLLPNGPAWPREEPTLRKLVAALCVELSRVAVREGKLGRELDPATTFECLTDWEASYGLPDCAQPTTLEGRRAAIAAKLLAQLGHDQNLDFWADLLLKLGYVLEYVNKGHAVMTVDDDVMDQLWDDEWEFVWELVVAHGLDDALLECVVQHQSLIETYPVVHYAWELMLDISHADLNAVASDSAGFTVGVGWGGQVLSIAQNLESGSVIATLPEDAFAVCSVDTVLLAAGVGAVNISRSTDGGLTWLSSVLASDELYGLSRGPADDQVAVAVGENGRIWRTDDAGLIWTEMVSPAVDVLRDVARCTGVLVAVGENGCVVRSTNNGTTWSLLAAGITAHLYGVGGWLLVMVAVGSDGEIWRSGNSGANWVQMSSPVASDLRSVVCSETGRWTACGDGGVILQSKDDGLTWQLQSSPTTNNLTRVTAHVPSGRAVIVGMSDTVITE